MEELIAKLTALLGDEAKAKEVAEKAAADGATDLASAALLTESDFTGYGVPKVKARMLLKELTEATKPAAPAPAAAPSAMTLLPSVPGDDAFLDSLRVGGVLKPQATDVLSAVRAILAHRIGIFDIEDAILEKIESRAESLGEPVAEVFFELEKAKGRKAHADVLRAIGVSGNFVTERRKKAFLNSVNGIWASLASFQDQIHSWRQTWQANMSNPAALVQAIGAIASGGMAGAAIGVGDAPDTDPISDAATGVIDDINKMFAGTGIPVARALAADAVQLRQMLDRPDLIAAVGTTTREEMLKTLGLAVSADVARAERSVSQYVLGVLELPKQPPGQQLTMYIIALETLGSSIPWEKLGAGGTVRPTNARTTASGRVDGRGQTY